LGFKPGKQFKNLRTNNKKSINADWLNPQLDSSRRPRVGTLNSRLTYNKFHEMWITSEYAPMQNPTEFIWLLEKLSKYQPIESMIEIGIAKGGTLLFWNEFLESGSKYYGLDLRNEINWNYWDSDIDIDITIGNTHDEQIYQKFKEKLNGKKVDFLFHDGDHSPDGAKQDIEWYGSFVKDGGIIAIQDTRLIRSWWDDITGSGINATHPRLGIPVDINRQETDIFVKEEFKTDQGTGIIYKIPGQTIVKFRDDLNETK